MQMICTEIEKNTYCHHIYTIYNLILLLHSYCVRNSHGSMTKVLDCLSENPGTTDTITHIRHWWHGGVR